MKTFKSGLFSLLVVAASLFSTSANAGNISGEPTSNVRSQLIKMVQNPNLAENGISETELYLQFKVMEDGEILLLAINTDNDYMIEFAKEKLHHQKIDLIDIPPNSIYNIRIKFELQ